MIRSRFLIALFTLATLSAQLGAESPLPVNKWHRNVAPGPDAATPDRLAVIRGRQFDHDTGAPYALDDPSASIGQTDGGFAEDRYFLTNPLPARDSDTVVIATFLDRVVALSPSRRSIYNVVHFSVERVLKSLSGSEYPGITIDFLVAGGSLNLNGRIVRYRENSGDDTPLEEGQRYLLFLKYSPEPESYFIRKHWKLEGGKVSAVDLLEKRRANDRTSQFDGHPEIEIIAAAGQAIRSEGNQQ